MIVHKFGGASVKDAESIRRVSLLLASIEAERAFIVISAMGKTTNKLEAITNCAFEGKNFVDLFDRLKDEHFCVLRDLMPNDDDAIQKLSALFDESLDVIENTPRDHYSYFYDQIVSFGERFSSLILEKYLQNSGFDVKLLDASKLFSSDENWRAGNINLEISRANIENAIKDNDNKFLITQGFIAGTDYGDYLTLGREGSDYSAGLIAAFSNATDIIFWKDVDGIYSADPKIFKNAVKIDRMSYDEMIELSYFGAKVLHEKTLFALQDKNIAMQVRSFLDVNKTGTSLYNISEEKYPPIKILSENQILFTCNPRERALINSNHIKHIYDCANDCNVNISLIQMSALKISFCAVFDEFACTNMISKLKETFKVKYNTDILLVTLRHYSDKEIAEFESTENILLSQISRGTAQYVFKRK